VSTSSDPRAESQQAFRDRVRALAQARAQAVADARARELAGTAVRRAPARTGPPAQRREVTDVQLPFAVRVAGAWSWRLLVVAGALALVGYVLGYFHELLVPLLLAVLLSALLSPVVNLLDRRGLPRVVAVLAVLLATILVIIGLLTLVATQIATGFSDLSNQAVAGLAQMQDWLRDGPLNVSNAQLDGYLDRARDTVSANSGQLVTGAVTVTSTAAGLFTTGFLAFFLTIFMLYDGRRIFEWVIGLLPRSAEAPVEGAVRRGWVTLVAYVRATVIVAVVDALGIGIGAAIIGIPLAVPLAVLVFLGAFVPIVGATLSGVVAVLVGLVAIGPVAALWMLGVVLLVQLIESHVLQPFLLGRAVDVHPVAVIIAIAAGITLAGIPGALFAVPFIAVANTVITHLVRGDTGDAQELPEGAAEAPLMPDPVDDEQSGQAAPRG